MGVHRRVYDTMFRSTGLAAHLIIARDHGSVAVGRLTTSGVLESSIVPRLKKASRVVFRLRMKTFIPPCMPMLNRQPSSNPWRVSRCNRIKQDSVRPAYYRSW